jgi:hypothetical protein
VNRPDTWNAENYQNRARMWRQKADSLPIGQERDACLTLADGYANLAVLIEAAELGNIPAKTQSG